MRAPAAASMQARPSPARSNIRSVNIERKVREARRKAKAEAKREKRQARRREKGAPQAGPVKYGALVTSQPTEKNQKPRLLIFC